MTKLCVAAVMMLAVNALADVGPKPAPCNIAGKGCTTCSVNAGAPPGACELDAQDAGLVAADCSDRSGSVTQYYYCPKGTTLVHSSCASVPFELFPLAALVLLLRRRS